jgi:hypothetical protein
MFFMDSLCFHVCVLMTSCLGKKKRGQFNAGRTVESVFPPSRTKNGTPGNLTWAFFSRWLNYLCCETLVGQSGNNLVKNHDWGMADKCRICGKKIPLDRPV